MSCHVVQWYGMVWYGMVCMYVYLLCIYYILYSYFYTQLNSMLSTSEPAIDLDQRHWALANYLMGKRY